MKKIYTLLMIMSLVLVSTGVKAANYLSKADSLNLLSFFETAGGTVGGTDFDTAGNWFNSSVDIRNWEGIVVDTMSDDSVHITELSTENLFVEGTIDPAICNLSYLTVLKIIGDEDGAEDGGIRAQEVSGTLPSNLWNLTNLTKIQIKFTSLSGGGIPTENLSNMTSLSEVNFQQSYIGGEIPEALFNLSSLKKCYLHENTFSGDLPSSLSNATNLTRLYLTDNTPGFDTLPYVALSGTEIKVKITGNYFSHDEVIKYHNDANAGNYGEGSVTDSYQYTDTVYYTESNTKLGDTLTFDVSMGGSEYAWFKDESEAPMFTTVTDSIITIDSVSLADTGLYSCNIQFDDISAFVIYSAFVVSGVDTTTNTVIDDDDQVSVSQQEAISFSAYPNPCNDELTIAGGSAINAYSVMDVTGKTVLYSSAINENNTTISVADLNKGLYFVTISSNGTVYTSKFIKQ